MPVMAGLADAVESELTVTTGAVVSIVIDKGEESGELPGRRSFASP